LTTFARLDRARGLTLDLATRARLSSFSFSRALALETRVVRVAVDAV